MDASVTQQTYRQTVRELSDRLVEIQRPIRILDAIKWDASVREAFFAAGARELPRVDRAYYEARTLGFDPSAKHREIAELEREIQRRLGSFNPVAGILRRMCREYDAVVRLLDARGKPEFGAISQELYGSAADSLHAGGSTLIDLADTLTRAVDTIDRSSFFPEEEKTFGGEEAVAILEARLAAAFPDAERPVRVVISDGILADAAAGSDTIKIRKEARFSARDLRLLEVHEGWVHLGTTLNGRAQPHCTFLSKGPPSSTATQEGLAILVEILAFASHPARLRRLANRILATHKAEAGANFLEVFAFLREQGLPEREAWGSAVRVFRGSTPDGPPFTKDITYNKGFVLVYNFIHLAVKRGRLARVPLLFCGKTTLEDLRTLNDLVEEGLVTPPRYLPPIFADLNALSAWMCYDNFLSRLDLERVEADYAGIL